MALIEGLLNIFTHEAGDCEGHKYKVGPRPTIA